MNLLTKTAVAFWLTTGAITQAGQFDAALEEVAQTPISQWAQDPAVVNAVKAQNEQTQGMSESDILALDQSWRDQTVTGGDMIDTVLANDLSTHLRGLQAQYSGQFTEIFVTDGLGLNVGQSAVTSDYWQGDEAKFQEPSRTLAVHFGEVEFDESSQEYQSQISYPILEDGALIGVITVGVNVERLALAE